MGALPRIIEPYCNIPQWHEIYNSQAVIVNEIPQSDYNAIGYYLRSNSLEISKIFQLLIYISWHFCIFIINAVQMKFN